MKVLGIFNPFLKTIAVAGLLVCATATAQSEPAIIFQIGVSNRDYSEFAIAGHYADYDRHFPQDVNFVVGQSDRGRDWPYILPGPADAWAGRRSHTFQIHFQLPDPASNYCRLSIDFVGTHPSDPPTLTIGINGEKIERKLPAGRGEEVLTNPRQGQRLSLEQVIPPALLHTGDNTITLASSAGSWALFDDIRLESGAAPPENPLTVEAEPLPFFKSAPDGLQRAVKIAIENEEGGSGPAELLWTTKTRAGSEKFDLHFGHDELLITVPDVDQIDLTLKTQGREIKTPVMLPPSKKWHIFIVPTVHTDIGYTDLQDRVRIRHANNGLHALDMVDRFSDFKWFSETFWQLDCLLRLHPDKADAAFSRLREKRMGLSGGYANMLTGLCSCEALNRLTLDSRNLANRGGFDLDSVVLDDVPSAVGSVPMVFANSGIKYFIEGCNRDRAPYSTQNVPVPFYWEGPDGSRVLAAIVRGYGLAGRYIPNIQRAMEQLPALLEQYEVAAYPYDALLMNGAFSDNGQIQDWLPQVVEKWNAQWEYPKLTLALPGDFFGYIEKSFSNSIPVLKTDFGGWWEDGAGSTALETSLSRRAEERAVTAEMLHSLASVLSGATYPNTNFDDVWHNILLYNEHTWGAAGSIRTPRAEQTVKQWEVKGSFARAADSETRELLASGMAELAAMTPSADVVVFNQLAWPRKALVRTDLIGAVRDEESKHILPCQPLNEGGSCFLAEDLPSIGYRSYRQAVLITPPPAAQISDNQMENEFYRVTLNPKTGGIGSIYDKQIGRELVDTNSECGLGELIYVTGGEGTYAIHSDITNLPPKFEYHWQTGGKIQSANGPVFGELSSEASAENFPKIMLRVRLYHGLKQLDLVCELDKMETTTKEAVYIAFPFALDATQGGLWLEYPDEITEPLKDQHASACRDWYSVQRWLAVSDGTATVELSPLDTPLVTLGHMTASTWPRETSLNRGHVFAYIMNNYWHTNYKAEQGGHFVFHFSLTSARRPFSRREALVNGWNMYCPPAAASGKSAARPLLSSPAKSLVDMTPAGLPLTAIKKAENGNGFIFRFCDLTGQGGTAKLALPRAAREVSACNLVETDAGRLKTGGKTIVAPVNTFGPLTLRVSFAP